MRLLQITAGDQLTLANYDEDKLPPYAILSHTWGADDEEVTFEDVEFGRAIGKAGSAKIMFCGQQAKKDDLEHFWVDTCCIRKSSDAELSEAINSMFRWYSKASKCYVYLSDVSTAKRDSDGQACSWEDAFRRSRWFTRGWTLQELLAPKFVEFWSRDGKLLGAREGLCVLISNITGIPRAVLCGRSASEYTANERLRWAARRETKRPEDRAYSLLGIFGVSMSAIYGEGKDRAHTRLSHEIDKLAQRTPDAAFPHAGVNSIRAHEPSSQRRQELLDSLYFDQIDIRLKSIKGAQHSTCEWMLGHPLYKAWTESGQSVSDSDILWIAGKPGAGKSTIMKFIYIQAKKAKLENELVLSFFFNARGEDLEKTTLGLYQSLLFQLLQAAPDLQAALDDVGANTIGTRSSAWTVERLQEILYSAVQKLQGRCLKVFIDALDECEEQQVLQMVVFLEDLVESASGQEIRLQVCFASRHYPTINVNRGWRLVLEDQPGHAEDLSKYIKRRLQISEGKLVTEVQAEVQEKANGVFMWVVLVVDILNAEFRRGRMFAVRQRLKEVPTELSELFKDLLRRDCVNMEELLLCIQWVLFAKRPLSPVEFYSAMAIALDGDAYSEAVTIEDISRFVLNSSKGLAELTKSRKGSTVQFIHESVRDFLLKDGGLCELWPGMNGKEVSLSHDRLKECCSKYMIVNLSAYASLQKPLPKATSEEFKAAREELCADHPFLEYACNYVLHHAEEAAQNISQEDFIKAFALQVWIHIANALERHELRRHSDQVTLCYIAAEHNLARLLKTLGSDDGWRRVPTERYQFPVIAAFANGHEQALRSLVGEEDLGLISDILGDPGYGKPDQIGPNKDVVAWGASKANFALSKCLVRNLTQHGLLVDPKYDGIWQFRNEFKLVARQSSTTRLRLMFERMNDRTVIDVETYSEALSRALRLRNLEAAQVIIDQAHSQVELLNCTLRKTLDQNLPESVAYLLDHGAHFNGPLSVRDDTALCRAVDRAVERNQSELVQVLLDRDINVNAEDERDRHALLIAADSNHGDMMQLLLDAGANVNVQGGLYGNALQAACAREENSENVRLLLDRGADVNTQGGYYGNALQAACAHDIETVRLLLGRGADPNLRVNSTGNVLYFAATNDLHQLAELLLDAGADANAEGGPSGNALQAACVNGKIDLLRLLLDRGADVNARGGNYGTALQAACVREEIEIVRLLLDRSADVNGQGGWFGYALQAACVGQEIEVVRLLLDRGADVNAQGGVYGNALQAAVAADRYLLDADIIQLLLERGANVNARGGEYGSALRAAQDRPEIRQLLINHGATE